MPLLLVDADGTLWEENPVLIAARRVASYVAEEADVDAIEVYRAICRIHRKAFWEKRFMDALDWRRVVEAAVAEVCHGDCAALAARAAGKHEEWLPWAARRVRLLPGVREALKSLRSAGFRVAVVSNALPKYLHPPLGATGLARLVDAVVSPADVRLAWAPPVKPWRPIFVEALVRAGADGPVYAVGNQPLLDCVGALRVGAERCFLLGEAGRLAGLVEAAGRLDDEEYVAADGSLAEAARAAVEREAIVPVRGWEEAARRLLEK